MTRKEKWHSKRVAIRKENDNHPYSNLKIHLNMELIKIEGGYKH